MSLHTFSTRRRSFLLTPLVGGMAWAAGLFRPARAQGKATLLAKRVERVPQNPEDELWRRAEALHVPMAPQAVVKPRIYEPGVKDVTVRALYDERALGLLLEWGDGAQDAVIGGVASFRDAIAVEFPAEPANGIPYFGMGEPDKPVTIYHWKADWASGREPGVDEQFPHMAVDWYPFSGREPGEIAEPADYGRDGGERVFHTSWWAGNTLGDLELHARTAVEKLRAEGFGTIRPVAREGQDGRGAGVWKDGAWRVALSVPRDQTTFRFTAGATIPIAFAAWDGARRQRGGEKTVSTWYFLSFEQPVGTMAYVAPVLAFAGALAAQAWGLRRLRRRAREQGDAAAPHGDPGSGQQGAEDRGP